ncbi:sulfatase-like hydrolase/transferase [Polaribacter sargassicola]|uniref:sulfatase-like hydrolase/transferase n=1 Tax=Polaribacter sargassicola TaxID=2836891 RepID=UPI001EFFB752|nr:sulfatase-like hydrolase/transferase [Polaribacter sp. DS7-9]MCG1037103.1 sulfatase-like hydrolase/transferase [Polaribacter sp. DS7-9]
MGKIKGIFFLVLVVILVSCKTKQERNTKPNFIFIMVDDLGKEWFSSYGATEILTPNIDAFAKKGIMFNNAYSMPQCTPSRIVLITGQYPYNNGWVNHYDVPRWGLGANFDADKNPSFAKALQNAGYKTGVAGKWQINDFRIEPDAMTKAGFDEFCMWTGYESGNQPSDKRYWDPYIFTKEGSKTYQGKFGPDIFSDFVIDFMSKNKDNPFFVYYPMVLTHSPFVHTPHEPNVKTKYQKHQAMVRYTDYIIGKILQHLESSGLSKNTYVVLTTDNGTSPSIIGKRNGVYVRGGKAFLTENGINAPFLVKTPDSKHFETNALVDFTDIFPTFLELAGVHNTNSKLDGHSFAKVLTNNSTKSNRDYILSMGGLPAHTNKEGWVVNALGFRDRVLRNEKYKVYVDTLKQIHRLYDLENDPYEENNLYGNVEIEQVLKTFKSKVDQLPNLDENPKYTKTKGLPTDVKPEFLDRAVERLKNRKNNMMPLATEEQFLKLIKANNH